MMLSVSPNCIVRSSLDEMLEALQRRDEDEMRWDVPPALPRRVVSRSRPPSAKRRLPVSSEAEDPSGFCATKGEMSEQNAIGNLEHFQQVQLNTVAVTFQSYVRGEIARKEYDLLRLKKQVARENQGHSKMLPLEVEDLQKRLSMIEATLELKEKENALLRQQVEQYKARWSEFEAKTKSNEENWQKQIASLQMDLAAAQKSGVAEGEEEGFSPGVKECKAREVGLEEERRAAVEVENWQYASSAVEKVRGMMKGWGKANSNTKIHSVGHSEVGDRHWRTWWGKKSKRR